MTEKTSEDSGLRKRVAKSNEKTERSRGKDDSYQRIVVKKLKDTLDDEITKIVDKMERDIKILKHHVISQVESIDMYNEEHVEAFRRKTQDGNNVRNGKKGMAFDEKKFQVRDSLLTELFRVPHIRTIYHIFVALLVNLVLSVAVRDYVRNGTLSLGFRIISWNFGILPLVFLVWFAMQLSTFAVYYFFVAWGRTRVKLHSSGFLRRTWDAAFALLLLAYVVAMLTAPTYVVVKLDFTVVLSVSLLTELVRFLMKTHAFVRTCAPRVVRFKCHGNRSAPDIPTFGKFAYFMFAPTLIYRDEYPRSSEIRWKVVLIHFAEVMGVIFLLAFSHESLTIPLAKDFGKTEISWEAVVVIFFGVNAPALFLFLGGFFLLLHSWMNAFAEMLRFGDRMFYQDWWNCSSFPEYYKKWNIIVHDWLYAYIYRDATLHLTRSKAFSTWLVFITSALFHEFILAFTFKFCYPVLFIVFGICSTCLYFVPRRFFQMAGNFFMWLMLVVGTEFCVCLYLLEFFARVNCPPTTSSPVLDFFIPRSWMCATRNN